MPTYEYVCTECRIKTEVRATISEKEKGLKVRCQECGSKKMTQVFGSFAVLSSSGNTSSNTTCGPSCGPGCR